MIKCIFESDADGAFVKETVEGRLGTHLIRGLLLPVQGSVEGQGMMLTIEPDGNLAGNRIDTHIPSYISGQIPIQQPRFALEGFVCTCLCMDLI